MNRNLLTVMGCSTSIVALLATGHAAQADTSPAPSSSAVVQSDSVPFEVTFQAEKIDPDSDTIGDLAIEKFRCDCPSCRVAVVQMLQAIQRSL